MEQEKSKKVKGLTKDEKSEAKQKIKDLATEDLKVSPEEMKKLEEMMKLAKMPIEMKDSDVKLGEGEVDIRKLSDANFKQMLFRLFVLNNVYIRDLCSSMIDLLRLVMLLLKKLGVEDVTKAMGDLMEELSNQVKSQQKLN